ncbi:MBL fold metallo-hydrolase [Georgenia ruanii]|uniref:MBL fold metallo-hydrolase n=1 Tax=Georgenia ruanii TaxID=348442 RepID=A0A7J9UYX5_9MICO|nr:MBL fold metallo-hydrolase [Georgenia ruanii]MPV89837.1 MBL fold metallo-hydrolase [Georgenia ruanii]
MRITHFGQSCLLLETGAARLLFDPGTVSEGFEELRGLDAILLTHQHPDHVDPDRLPALVAANPGAAVVCDPDTAPLLATLGVEARTARPGDHLDLAGAAVDVRGGEHAVIYADRPGCTNAAYLVDGGAFFHPGDAFSDPGAAVDVLGAPTSGPWLKLAEAIDYVRAVKPRVAVPIHERAMATTRLAYGLFAEFAPEGTTFRPLPTGEATEV